MEKKEIRLLVVVPSTVKNKLAYATKIGSAFKKANICCDFLFYQKNGELPEDINQDFIAIVDPQIPIRYIVELAEEIQIQNADVIALANQKFSYGFLSRLIFRTPVPIGPRVAIFKSTVAKRIRKLDINSEFMIKAQSAGFKVKTIKAETNYGGNLNVFIKSSFNLLKLKINKSEIVPFDPDTKKIKGEGFHFRNQEFVHYDGPEYKQSAFSQTTYSQTFFIFAIIAAFAAALIINWHTTLVVTVSVLTIIYFLDLLFNLFLIFKSFKTNPEIEIIREELEAFDKTVFPAYSILCPLYKEWQVLPQFVKSMERLDYPKDKLQVLLLLEENDSKTIEEASKIKLPDYFEIIIVPNSNPKTKPKACNFGLQFVRGEYTVIFDAEDMPEPNQLKKAVLAFSKSSFDVVCMQAKLNFYNSNQNLLTKIFTAEYSLWFDLVLPGLQSVNAPLPLGGTSNHFRTKDLKMLKGWDAFNVTEDCDLGMRLAKEGFKTAIFNSTTWEEANSRTGNWFRQRSRWIKGYIQTYLVHIRHWKPFKFRTTRNLLFLQLTVGGKITSIFINPLMWLITISYFAFRSEIGPTIESFFPAPILYMGVFSFVFGNFLYLYYYMVGCARRGFDGLVKYALLVPFYWIGMSIAAWKALYELIIKPHYWAKTIHGYHLNLKEEKNGGDPSVKKRIPDKKNIAVGGGILMLATLGAGFINLLFNLYLGRNLSLENFGILSFFNNISLIFGVAVSALVFTINQKTSYLQGKYGEAGAELFFDQTKKNTFVLSISLSLIWLIATPFLMPFFQIPGYLLGMLFSLLPFAAIFAAAYRGYLQGISSFALAGIIIISETLAKFLISLPLVQFNQQTYVMLALPASVIISLILTRAFVNFSRRDIVKSTHDSPTENSFPIAFFTAALLSGLSGILFLNFDVILAKHYLNPLEAGQYSLLSLIGKMIFYLGSILNVFIVTFVSRNEGKNKNSRKIFYQFLAGEAVIVLAGWISLGYYGHTLVPLFFGAKSVEIISSLSKYATAIALLTITTAFITYHMSKKQLSFSVLPLFAGFMMTGLIIHQHDSVASIINAVFLSSFTFFITTIMMHIIFGNTKETWDEKQILYQNVERPQKILFFNWRDTKHLYGGGAETYIQELAKRWVDLGNDVVIFCGNDGKSQRRETIDGVKIIRRGGFYLVYIWAFLYYIFKFRGKFDLIIDCQNGIPFFTPLYAKEPIVCLLHHVHQEVFYKYLPHVLAYTAGFLEKRLMPLVYKNTRFITISRSSKESMRELSLGLAGVTIVPPGVDLKKLKPGPKSPSPLIVYLGRLKAYKSIDVLIRALPKILKKVPKAKLAIVGGGEEDKNLELLAEKIGLKEKIIFTGKVDSYEKSRWLSNAWVTVNPSMIEGWGMTTIEANACGVPVVASRVPGLIDSVNNPHTGLLAEYGNEDDFAMKISLILLDPHLRKKMGENALIWAQNFDWERIAPKALHVFLKSETIEQELTPTYESIRNAEL